MLKPGLLIVTIRPVGIAVITIWLGVAIAVTGIAITAVAAPIASAANR